MRLKVLIPFLTITLLGFAVMGTTYLGAEEMTTAAAGTSLQALAVGAALPADHTLAIPEPSRLLLLIIGVIFVGIAYRRSWVSYRETREKS